MVPLDQPRAALDMLRRFLVDQAFSDSEQTSLGVGSCSGKDALDCDHDEALASPAAADRLTAPAPPEIMSTPKVGPDFAVVDFVPGGGDADSDEEVASAISFEVRSSPDGKVGSGASPPVRVDGLTPGRAYTFTVTAVRSALAVAAVGGVSGTIDAEEDGLGQGVVRSEPSVGSPAVTPGCGKEASGPVQRDCSGHGTCKEDGSAGACVCENGYAGDKCEVMLAGGVRGGGGGTLASSPEMGGVVAHARGAGDIKVLLEEDVPMLNRSTKVRLFWDECVVGMVGLCVDLFFIFQGVKNTEETPSWNKFKL